MTICELNQPKTLADFYLRYLEHIKTTQPNLVAKTQTGWMRYTLPGYGFPLKLEGNLTLAEVNAGLQFMHTIPLAQVEDALAVQAQVYQLFGDRISPSVQRVYRSQVRKSLEWGQQQPFWQSVLGNRRQNCAASMQPPRGPCRPVYRLKLAQRTAVLHQELEHLCVYWQQVRLPRLASSSIKRYLKDVENVLGWCHHIQGVPLENLRLTTVVPQAALLNPHVAQQVTTLATDYLQWLRTERAAKPTTQTFALSAFVHITEYLYYVEFQFHPDACTASDAGNTSAQ